MNKKLLFFSFLACLTQFVPAYSITIKKAAPVATKDNGALKKAETSLLPTVINLYSNIQDISNKQKALTEECKPSSAELKFVNDTFKEWIKTGAMSENEVYTSLGGLNKKCTTASGGYEMSVRIAYATEETSSICYDNYSGSGNDDMIWAGYPIAKTVYYCTDDPLSSNCSGKERQEVSNIYEIFNLIDFSTADYTKQEAKMAGTLKAKIEKCSSAKLNAKQRAMWSEFLVGTIGNLGQSTNTGNIMQVVQESANSGGMGALKSLGGSLTQFLQ